MDLPVSIWRADYPMSFVAVNAGAVAHAIQAGHTRLPRGR